VLLVFAAIFVGMTAALAAGTLRAGLPAVILSGQLPIWGIAASAVAYLLLIITFWVLMRIYTLQRVWRRVVAACVVVDLAAASDVAAAGEIVSAFGEGLADGLDFGL
jgi:glucan phosphoethanolaminetransferase (alkaline phosphatase superfamily)